MSYDSAVTTFSPDGHLIQVEYAQEAVRRGSTVIGLCTSDCIVVGVERKACDPLQLQRTARKILLLDDHMLMTFAGLTADARVLINRARAETQSHRLNTERPATAEYITRYVAKIKQNYTQSNGRRPFGVSFLIGGFDDDGQPHLYQTEPTGIYYEWQANTTGRLGSQVRKLLESKGQQLSGFSEAAAIKFVVRALVETTSLSAEFYEVAVLKHKQPLNMVSPETVEGLVKLIKSEMAAEQSKARQLTKTL